MNKVDKLLEALATDDSCHRCGGEFDKSNYSEEINGGTQYDLYITFNGGYMAFEDRMEEGCSFAAHLCHDCCAQLYRFMGFNPWDHADMRGLHPDRNDGPAGSEMCCEYAWRSLPGFGGYQQPGVKITEDGWEVISRLGFCPDCGEDYSDPEMGCDACCNLPGKAEFTFPDQPEVPMETEKDEEGYMPEDGEVFIGMRGRSSDSYRPYYPPAEFRRIKTDDVNLENFPTFREDTSFFAVCLDSSYIASDSVWLFDVNRDTVKKMKDKTEEVET